MDGEIIRLWTAGQEKRVRSTTGNVARMRGKVGDGVVEYEWSSDSKMRGLVNKWS